MNSQDGLLAQNERELEKVLEKVREIAEKSISGDYIFRGEPEHYSEVSSGLYRFYQKLDGSNQSFEVIQSETLAEAKKYTGETNEFEILAYIQHFGGKTNLIDFTTDKNVALFFACGEPFDKDGRMVLLRREIEGTDICIKKPWKPLNRVTAQKSVFVQPKKGYLDQFESIKIPKELKHPILDYLRTNHGITSEEIRKDLHEFIRQQNLMELSAHLNGSQMELCNRMDEMHTIFQLKAKPSDMFIGFISAIESQGNPDRIAQAAHSLREILFPFWSSNSKIKPLPYKTRAFEEYGTVFPDGDLERLERELDKIYDDLSHLAHHGVVSANHTDLLDIEELRTRFERVMERALTRQAEVYNEIDRVLNSSPG
ncbi:MAG: FRG domain-containing protein [Caldilineaceae bacterium]|nr:FRG domain-containing protein [Caldilineaceae bacterium]